MKNRKNVKRGLALALAVATSISAFGLAGCKKKVSDTTETLEVFVWEAGYGVEWCKSLLDSFAQEDWVKAKYPNLEIVFDKDGNKATYNTKIDAGERANTVDLFFTASLSNYVGKDVSGNEFFCDLTETVFNQKVPNEEITVKDKMLPTYLDSIRYYDLGEDSNSDVPFKSYVFPWASGMDSIIYNADHLEAMNLEVPLTTKQFIETCDTISKKGVGLDEYYSTPINDKGGYAIMTDGGGNYWNYLYPVWWAQYEGIEEYYNFFNGVHNDMISAEVFKQKGKLYSLTTMENILKWKNNFVYKESSLKTYMEAQSNFLKGDGVFYAQGDWFAKEMESTKAQIKSEYGIDYNIRMMKMPIVSEIINDGNTPTIPNEETLRAVIRAIDEGYDSVASALQAAQNDLVNVSEADYAKIMEARGIVHAIGPLHQAGVPSYAKGKDVAFDFLRYMATDKAQEIYMKATGGASLPFNYDLKTKNPALYDELFANSNVFAIEQDRLSFLYEQCYETHVLPDPNSFPLVKWGGMSDIHSLNGSSVVAYFIAQNSLASGEKLYNDDILYYYGTTGTDGAFSECRSLANL